LIEKHGANARKIAESMADARRASKDYEGCAMWLCVLGGDQQPRRRRAVAPGL